MNETESSAAGYDSEEFATLSLRPAQTGIVLFVSSSSVTATVVSRIVGMTGLKCLTLSPAEAEQRAADLALAAVIVDEDAELAGSIVGRLNGEPARRPRVMLLATSGPLLEAARRSPFVDAVVAKPVTAESLQPLLFELRPKGDDAPALSLHRSERL